MALGALYHTQNGSYIQPVEGGAGFVVNYTTGQFYGTCSDNQIAPPAQLAIRGLAFKLLPADYDQTKYKWNVVTMDVDAIPAISATNPIPAEAKVLPTPFDKPSANPTNKEVFAALRVIYDKLEKLK